MSLLNFEKWLPLDNIAIKDVPKQGDYGFVYIFRRCSTKELLYIGSTTDLCQRLFGNYIGGHGGQTTRRIHRLLFEEGNITDTEVAWKEVSDYELEERHLRKTYFEQQGRLPPWNKQL